MQSILFIFRAMILIVDDKEENIFSLKSLLSVHDFVVDTASSGEEALKKVLTNDYAVIIMDVQMPGMDGFETAEALSGSNKSKDVPIVFLSAVNTDKHFVTKGYTSGGADYVTKPVDPDILLLKVRNFYKFSEQTRALKKARTMLRREVDLRRQAENEQAEAMRELQAVMESLPQIAFTVNKMGEIDYVNEKWYEYSEKKGSFPVHHPDDEPVCRAWEKAFQEGQAFSSEIRIRKVNSRRYKYYLFTSIPIRENEVVHKWVGTLTDIHRQKTLNDILEHRVKQRTRDLVKKNKELAISNHELQQFAWVASHDLKEPLRKIQTFNYLVRDRYLEPGSEGADYLDRAIRSSQRMSDLIDNLLQYSRLSAAPVFEKTDLNVIVREILFDLEVVIREKKAQITVGDMPVIDAVPSQIRQVFQNLVSNALKFSRPDVPLQINIGSEYLFASDGSQTEEQTIIPMCGISIADNGIGFDEKFKERIFVIFQRLHTRESYEGTGIGLAITKKIVERHNGTITVVSRENEGTVFTITLPIKNTN